MSGYQQRSCRYPNLLVTVKNETDERSVSEISSNSRTHRSKNNYHSTFHHPTTIYYNSNYRYQQQKQYIKCPPLSTAQRRSQNYNHFSHHNQQQTIRPLMEIKDNQFSFHNDINDKNIVYSNAKPKEPSQRGQYRNRKAELDWDHAFDLDQIDLYTLQNDIDTHSLSSINSSGDNSLSSF